MNSKLKQCQELLKYALLKITYSNMYLSLYKSIFIKISFFFLYPTTLTNIEYVDLMSFI